MSLGDVLFLGVYGGSAIFFLVVAVVGLLLLYDDGALVSGVSFTLVGVTGAAFLMKTIEGFVRTQCHRYLALRNGIEIPVRVEKCLFNARVGVWELRVVSESSPNVVFEDNWQRPSNAARNEKPAYASGEGLLIKANPGYRSGFVVLEREISDADPR